MNDVTKSALHRRDGRAIGLVVPMLLKDRCIGVFDLEPGARCLQQKRQAADAAGVGSGGRDREQRGSLNRSAPTGALRSCGWRSACRWRCCRSCRSGCAAWMWRGISIRRASWAATSATSSPEANTGRGAGRRVGRACRRCATRRSAKWCAAARSGAASKNVTTPAALLAGMNHPHERNLGNAHCTLCYAMFGLRRRR